MSDLQIIQIDMAIGILKSKYQELLSSIRQNTCMVTAEQFKHSGFIFSSPQSPAFCHDATREQWPHCQLQMKRSSSPFCSFSCPHQFRPQPLFATRSGPHQGLAFVHSTSAKDVIPYASTLNSTKSAVPLFEDFFSPSQGFVPPSPISSGQLRDVSDLHQQCEVSDLHQQCECFAPPKKRGFSQMSDQQVDHGSNALGHFAETKRSCPNIKSNLAL